MTDGEQSAGGGPGPKPGSIAFYAALYGASERTVKRWNRTGADAGDAPPLAEPEKMLGWWARNMTQRVPDGISAAVIRWRRENGAPAPAVAVPADELPLLPEEKHAARKAVMDVPVDEDEIGPEQTLRRLLELEPKLHRLATEPGQAKDYLSTVARIGPAAERLRVENERQRKLISKDEAEAAIQSLHVPIKNEIYMMAGTMCQVLGLPLTPETEEKWRAECDRLLARFRENVFAA